MVRALPWELASPALREAGVRLYRRSPRTRGDAADVRGLQGALEQLEKQRLSPDGILGVDTRAALEAFQREHELPATGQPDAVTMQRLHAAVAGAKAPRVAIVHPSRLAEQRAFRGSRQSGVPLDWRYARAGYSPIVLESPTSDDLMLILHRQPVAILHLNVGLVEHHGNPAIDVIAAPPIRGRPALTGRITATALDRLVPRSMPSPLIVVDATAPKSRREMASQLLLRNAFAAELAAIGNVRALLATGLAQYSRQERLYDALIDALRDGGDVYDVAQSIRSLADSSSDMTFEDVAAYTATALFARSPSVRFPTPA